MSVQSDRRGSRNPSARISEAIVAQILLRLVAGDLGPEIAAAFGVSIMTVSDIRRGKTWRHVARPAYPQRPGIDATPRGNMGKTRRERVAAASLGLCGLCGRPLGPGFHVDHIVPLALGGVDGEPNLQALHPACHAEKTREDARRIAKAKRQAKLAPFTERPASRMRSAGFRKDIRRRMNGRVEKR